MTRFSRIDSEDSDEDGLTDYEESFLKTNALSKDTDGDGIEDRIEHFGFDLKHDVGGKNLGIIKTDPLDADTDDDLRSDGAEAELEDVELARWVVRANGAVKPGEVASSSAYRVYSNPLVADADYDGLVDGEEYGDFTDDYKLDPRDFYNKDGQYATVGDGRSDVGLHRTDPNNANTDGDECNDGAEIRGGMDPLADDIRVTVVIGSVEVDDAYGNLDAYDFTLKIGLPGEGPAGLREQRETFFQVNDKQVGRVWVQNRKQASFGSVIRVFYERRLSDFGSITRTAFEPTIQFDGGAERVGFYDPGAKGVPVGAQFRVGYRDAGNFDEVAPIWHTYSGNETAALG